MRAIIVVLDSLGVGQMPDAARYGDQGTDTISHIIDNYDLKIPNMRKLGFGNIESDRGLIAGGRLKVDNPEGFYCRLKEQSAGKDTITGHFEIAGLRVDTPFKTYPDGFPDEIMDKFVKLAERGYIGNYNSSGTVIIDKLGEEHEKTGKLIVYTSADSVFQIAANTDVVPLEELYDICEKTRKLLTGKYACGRVIARPYIRTADGKRTRTSDRHDYALSPPEKTLLDFISESGQTVYAIGKINDIFNGCGITHAVHTDNNDDGVTKTIEAIKQDFNGLIFTNLVDFDSLYGHRRLPEAYGKAIEAFDARLPEIMSVMKDDDVLFMCSDHGNDPVHTGFDHTREHIFCLGTGRQVKKGVDLGTRSTFSDIGATVIHMLTDGNKETPHGKSFWNDIRT